jgi:iron complex outermembrane receptor protein
MVSRLTNNVMTAAQGTLVLAVFVFSIGAPAYANDLGSVQEVDTLKRLSLEELMTIDVTTVSRRSERATEAAAAVSVIMGEDVRRSGASTLADSLRLADGLTVARFNAGTWAISARGFTTTTANKMLVQIDGRSVYTPLFSGVFWDAQDLFLPDLDRIEVIRGPAGTLWGANAINGVVNILNKPARDTQGLAIAVNTGSREYGSGGVRYGGRAGPNGHYRAYAKGFYFGSPRFADNTSAREPRRLAQAGVRLDWATQAGRQTTVQGDLYGERMGLADRRDAKVWGGNVLGRWSQRLGTRSRVELFGYVDHTSRMVPRQFEEERTTFDVELEHDVSRGRHELVWGGGYRVSADRTEGSPVVFFEPDRRTITLSNVYVQDEFTLTPQRVFLTAGSKFEHTSFTGIEIQPSARARVRVGETQTFWGGVARAVRTPTRFDQDIRVPVGDVVVIRGDPAFGSENVIAYEAGYRAQPSPRVSLDLAAFYNDYDHLRSQEAPVGGGVPIVLANELEGRGAGVELAGNVQPHANWLLHAGYTWLDIELRPRPGSRDRTGGVSEANDPAHQFTLRSYLDLRGRLEVDAFFRAMGAIATLDVPAYAELDLRVGWRLSPSLEVSVIGRDLLHDQHPEFGPPQPRRREYQREIVGRLIWRR